MFPAINTPKSVDLRHRWLLTGLFVIANLYAAWVFLSSGDLDPEFSAIQAPRFSVLLLAATGVVLSYWIFLWPIFRGLERIRILPYRALHPKVNGSAERVVGWFVFGLQVLFLYFVISEGTYIAGSMKKSDSLLKWVAIFLVPDSVFMVYYGLYRRSSQFYPNLLAYLISNFIRGWSGMWLYVIFFEIAHRVRAGRFRWQPVLVLLCAVAALLPAVMYAKWTMRGFGGEFEALGSTLDFSLGELYGVTFAWISMRVQHLSSVLAAIQGGDALRGALGSGSCQYFFEEGLPQFVLYRLFGLNEVRDVHSMIPELLLTLPVLDSESVSVVHLGLSGWIWLLPAWTPLYLVYVIGLGSIGVWMMKRMGGRGLAMDAIWLSWVLYLMNGWFAAYISFLQGLVIIAALRLVVGALQRPWPLEPVRAAQT